MDWQASLVKLYFYICDQFDEELSLHNQRFAKNTNWKLLKFSDEEVITSFLFGLTRGYKTVKEVYQYLKDHLLDWFPNLLSYQKYNERLNHLNDVLAHLVARQVRQMPLSPLIFDRNGQTIDPFSHTFDVLVDSMPIVLAKGKRADDAKVALEVANKGTCATKDLWYHGLKLHVLALYVPTELPQPCQICLSAASMHDNAFFKEQLAPFIPLPKVRVFADRIYHNLKKEVCEDLLKFYNVTSEAVEKRRKGQQQLFYDQKLANTERSRTRQPIEAFFNWLIVHSDIQNASLVRSTAGLFKHTWARIAAAFIKAQF